MNSNSFFPFFFFFFFPFLLRPSCNSTPIPSTTERNNTRPTNNISNELFQSSDIINFPLKMSIESISNIYTHCIYISRFLASRIEMQMKEERRGEKSEGRIWNRKSNKLVQYPHDFNEFYEQFFSPPRSFISVHVVKCSSLSIKNITLTPEIERPISLVVPGKLTFLYFTIHLKGTRLNLERFLTY